MSTEALQMCNDITTCVYLHSWSRYNCICCSVNLMAAIGCLANIAKQRSMHVTTVLQSFEHLHGVCILNVVFICWHVQQISNQTFDLFLQSLQELKSRVCDLSESENDG